jgi:hypothetical protein
VLNHQAEAERSNLSERDVARATRRSDKYCLTRKKSDNKCEMGQQQPSKARATSLVVAPLTLPLTVT